MLPAVSFVSEIFVDDHYADDGLRFATQAEALAYGEARTSKIGLGNASSAVGWPSTPRRVLESGPDYLKTLNCSAICGVARIVDIVTKNRSKWF